MTKFFENADGQITAGGFRRLALQRLSRTAPDLANDAISGPSDFDLNPGAEHEFKRPIGRRPAAVLVPVIAHAEPTVLFTERPHHLAVHAGQISFPGGKHDPDDATLEETALREAYEEIGLARTQVEALGFLEPYQTGTGYRIAPLVGLVERQFQAKPNPAEVSDVFEVPLSFLMNVQNHHTHQRMIKDQARTFYAIPFANRYIWGATAGILKNMHTRLFTE